MRRRRVRTTVLGPYADACPSDNAIVMSDRRWRPGAPRRGVLVCHSAGQRSVDQALEGWWPVPRALASSGRFVCLACDFGDASVTEGPTSGPHSWGNDHCLGLMTEAHALLSGPRLGADGPVLLAGTSMGAVVALNWARGNRSLVAAVLLACPVLHLREFFEQDRGGLAGTIAAAYGADAGGPVPALDGHDPARFAAELAGLPIRIYASADDPIASDTASCERWAAAVGGGCVTIVDLGPAGHWPVATPADDALAFATEVTSNRPARGGAEPVT